MRVRLETQLEDFVARSYSSFCSRPPEMVAKTGSLQQIDIPSEDGRVLLNFGVYGGYLSSYAALLGKSDRPFKAGQIPSTYGLVVKANSLFQVDHEETEPERIELRRQLLSDMWDALGSSIVGLSSDYRQVQALMINASPMRVVTHTNELPDNPKLLKQIDDILELIAQLSDSPTPELIERFENHVLFFEGRRAKIYDISPEAA